MGTTCCKILQNIIHEPAASKCDAPRNRLLFRATDIAHKKSLQYSAYTRYVCARALRNPSNFTDGGRRARRIRSAYSARVSLPFYGQREKGSCRRDRGSPGGGSGRTRRFEVTPWSSLVVAIGTGGGGVDLYHSIWLEKRGVTPPPGNPFSKGPRDAMSTGGGVVVTTGGDACARYTLCRRARHPQSLFTPYTCFNSCIYILYLYYMFRINTGIRKNCYQQYSGLYGEITVRKGGFDTELLW